MKKTLLPYEQTGYFNKEVTDYLSGASALKPFYKLPTEISSLPQIIEQKKLEDMHRDIVSNALMRQHAKVFADKNLPEIKSNIESLKNENTFTVTTAHQPNLFLGPLYVI